MNDEILINPKVPIPVGETTTFDTPQQVTQLPDIYGTFPQVTSSPTWTPKTFRDSFAIDTTNNLLWFYDFNDNVWLCSSKKRLVVVTQSATPAINTDKTDIAEITGLAQAITSMTSGLTGTPYDGQPLIVSVTDNGSARAITWGASFESSGNVTLPATTVISTRLDIQFIYNGATNKWRCIGIA